VSLENSSQWMSNDTASKNHFSHTDSLGRDPFQRMAAFGCTYTPAGENLAAGYSDAQDTLTQFVNACDPDSSGACTYAHRETHNLRAGMSSTPFPREASTGGFGGPRSRRPFYESATVRQVDYFRAVEDEMCYECR
jgi:hypothetical protein